MDDCAGGKLNEAGTVDDCVPWLDSDSNGTWATDVRSVELWLFLLDSVEIWLSFLWVESTWRFYFTDPDTR